MFFLEPRKPILPALDHEITWPLLLVSEMMMLLKDEWMWAWPVASTTTFFFFLTFFAIVLIFLGDQFLMELSYCDYFFLFATVLRFPLRVRELFFVR